MHAQNKLKCPFPLLPTLSLMDGSWASNEWLLYAKRHHVQQAGHGTSSGRQPCTTFQECLQAGINPEAVVQKRIIKDEKK